MQENDNIFLNAAQWLMPTIGEWLLYILGGIALILISNVTLLEQFLYFPKDISLRDIVLAPITIWLSTIIGERPASLVSVGLFWAIVGIFVYIAIWIFMNFSSEFSNDIKITKYAYPKGADRSAELRQFMIRNLFRISALVASILYMTVFSSVFMPVWTTNFRGLFIQGTKSDYLIPSLLSFLTVILALHVFTVLARLIMLRRRIFD